MPRVVDENSLLTKIRTGIGEDSYVEQQLQNGSTQQAATEIYSIISEINIPSRYVSE